MNNIAARMVYENAKQAIQNAGIPGNVKLTQGTLRVSQSIVVGQTVYRFPILANETQLGINNTEMRLQLQDSFVVSTLGFFLSVPASAVDAAYKLMTYPNRVLMTEAQALAAEAIYNGFLKLTVNNDVLIPKWDLMRHREVGQTQQTAALAASVNADQTNGAYSGFYPVEPNVVLIGSKNSVLEIQLPAGVASAAANARMEFVFRGVLAQNSTVVS